jgi:hypothetical protein
MYVCIGKSVQLAGSWMFEQILFIFSIQKFMRPRSVLSQSERSSSKNNGLSNGPENKMAFFFKTVLVILIKF